MITDPPSTAASSDDLGRKIRREAEMAAVIDPIFGGLLSAAILDHADLGSVVAYQIGERLGKTSAQRRQFWHSWPRLNSSRRRAATCAGLQFMILR
jgi:hypothetical protein